MEAEKVKRGTKFNKCQCSWSTTCAEGQIIISHLDKLPRLLGYNFYFISSTDYLLHAESP